jgi:integrase
MQSASGTFNGKKIWLNEIQLLEDIRKVQAVHSGLNQDAKDIWHLLMFTGIGPNEARGLQWSEVHFDQPTPHFEIRGNSLRRVKVGERRRRVPLVGTVLTTMQTRKAQATQNDPNVFPRYAGHKNANSLSKALVNPMRDAKVWVYLRKVPYSLRHSMKDWLRRTTPTNIQLLIMGHGHGEGRAAGGYGGDDLLEIQAEHLEKALRFGGVIDYPELPESLEAK